MFNNLYYVNIFCVKKYTFLEAEAAKIGIGRSHLKI